MSFAHPTRKRFGAGGEELVELLLVTPCQLHQQPPLPEYDFAQFLFSILTTNEEHSVHALPMWKQSETEKEADRQLQ